jgi:hypothetical protein
VRNLEANIEILKRSFNVDEMLEKDKEQAIRDSK